MTKPKTTTAQESIICPQCRYKTTRLTNEVSGETVISCHFCGYHEAAAATFLFAKVDGNWEMRPKLTKESKPILETYTSEGYGVMGICYGDDTFDVIPHDSELDKDIIGRYLSIMAEPEVCEEKSYLTVWDKKAKQVHATLGNLPI